MDEQCNTLYPRACFCNSLFRLCSNGNDKIADKLLRRSSINLDGVPGGSVEGSFPLGSAMILTS